MKKMIIFLVFIPSILISMSGCIGKEASADNMSSNEMITDVTNDNGAENSYGISNYSSSDIINEFGIELYATNITSTGLTLVCTQVGGNVEGELQTGSLYTIEKNVEGTWKEVKLQENLYWVDEILKVNEGESTEWNIDWTPTYGNLSAGEYRISKKFIDFKPQKDSTSHSYFAEFSIK